jgi:hypothetical protein
VGTDVTVSDFDVADEGIAEAEDLIAEAEDLPEFDVTSW